MNEWMNGGLCPLNWNAMECSGMKSWSMHSFWISWSPDWWMDGRQRDGDIQGGGLERILLEKTDTTKKKRMTHPYFLQDNGNVRWFWLLLAYNASGIWKYDS